MRNKELQSILTQIGLSENEARVYLAALSLGSATVMKIAKVADIKRTTVYAVVESLKQKGLMNIEIQGFKQLYEAEDPKKLEGILEIRKNQFKELLPEFSALYNLKGGESVVKYYEGLESIKSVYNNLLSDIKPHEEYIAISNAEQWLYLDEKWFEGFMERRAKLPISVRLLLQDSPKAQHYAKFMKNFHYTARILPKDTKFTVSITVTPQRTVVHQLMSPSMAIVIENKSIVNMHKEMFEVMWASTRSERKKD